MRASTSCRIKGISWGISRARPSTGKPPARAISTTTSTECEKPKMGWAMPRVSQIGVRKVFVMDPCFHVSLGFYAGLLEDLAPPAGLRGHEGVELGGPLGRHLH